MRKVFFKKYNSHFVCDGVRKANDNHHYAPYKGHAAEADFKKFFDDPYTLFEADLKDLYK